ncbi:MAG TPA: prolyl-tRNA synthetase associated domain-containing protein [Candidatus Saccharimonadales bacterium]
MQFETFITDTLRALEVPYRLVKHQAVFTVAESVGVLDEIPVKNLLLQEEKGTRKVLVIMAGEHRLDTKKLAAELGTKKLRFANAEALLETLGVTPGSVSLFSLFHDGSDSVEVVIDQELAHAEEVGFHPNDNTVTIFIPGASIKTVLDHTGHSYRYMNVRSNT